ncbi:MAG: phosphodiester glycosidase family protein [Verrucomicrobiota bacterium]
MKIHFRNIKCGLALILTLAAIPCPLRGAITISPWIPIFRGVDRATGEADAAESRVQKVNVLRVDLNDPGVALFSTPSNGARPLETDGQTTSQFLTTYGLQAAINANFFNPCCVTNVGDPKNLVGLAISQGQLVSPQESGTFSTSLLITSNNQASIASTPINTSNIFTAITGAEIILQNGNNVGVNPGIEPRTVAGLSQNNRYIYLLTVDGRQTGYSEGVNHFEAAQWLIRFGAYNGFILDGGGSTAMAMSDGAGGDIVLNRPINAGIPGNQRIVGNNLGVYAQPLPDVIVTALNWTPTNLVAGTGMVFRATIKNQGAGATPQGIILGVGFLVDGVGVSYTDKYTNSLAPGASITLTADGGPSGTNVWFGTAGDHVVTATVDDVARFSESNETNNSFALPFHVFRSSYAVNSGGGAVSPFSADAYFTGGSTLSVANVIITAGVSNSAPQAVYQTERSGTFSYSLTNLMPGATHAVRLHFAEVAANFAGERVFNVSLNSAQVLTNFDILAETVKYKALVKTFSAKADAMGKISINYISVVNNPKSSGIEAIFVSAPTNTAPTLAAISNTTINAGSMLTFTNSASDSDIPAQTVTFSLDPGAPAGASVGPTSGVFTWTAPTSLTTTTNAVVVRVTDNGSPPLSATRGFNIVVIAPPRSDSMTTSNGMVQLTWSVYPGKTYRLQFKNDFNETAWTEVPGDIVASGATLSFTDNVSASPKRFYRLRQLN